MDELIKELADRAGLTEAQAKAAAEVVVEWVKDENKRKKILTAAVAATIASASSRSRSELSNQTAPGSLQGPFNVSSRVSSSFLAG